MLHTLLCLLPAAAVMLPLLARRYPGERLLLALRGEHKARFPRARSTRPSRVRATLLAGSGDLLLGLALAVRPPPAPAMTS